MFTPQATTIVLIIQAVSVLGQITCPTDLIEIRGWCGTVRETTYPYECRYQFPRIFDYGMAETLWLSKRDENYGYFIDNKYRKSLIMQSAPIQPPLRPNWTDSIQRLSPRSTLYSNSECISKTKYNIQILSNCTIEGVYGLCIYDPQEQQFCSQYTAICGSNCKGKSKYKSRFICGASYDEDGESCEHCDEEFEKYPDPTIELHRESDKLMAVVIKNPLKKALEEIMNSFNGVFCYSNLRAGSEDIRKRVSLKNNPKLDTYDVYILEFSYHEEGVYYCEMFTYPNETLVQSEEVIVTFDTHNFIVNVTVDMPVSGIEYEVLIDQTKTLSDILKSNQVISVEPMVLYPQVNGKNTIGFRVYAPLNEGNIGSFYDEIKRLLPSNYSLSTCEYCLEKNLAFNGQTMTWPQSKLGTIASTLELFVDEDGFPITRSCQGTFKQGTFWTNPHLSPTKTPSSLTRKLYDILMNTNLTAQEVNTKLAEVIQSNSDIVVPYDVYLIAKCLERIINSIAMYDGKIATETIEATMKFNHRTLYLSQVKLNATDTILYAYDRILQNQIINDKDLVLIKGEETIGSVININGNSNGVAVYKTNRDLSIKLINVANYTEIDKTNLMIASYFPTELLEEIRNITREDIFLVSSVFLNNRLFNDEENRPNWQVMSMFVPGLKDPYFVNTFPVIFGERFETLDVDQSCGYWDYGIDSQLISRFGKWKQNGQMIVGDNYKICYFNHMTHFALIFGAPENKGLNILTATMTSISLLCILIIFLTAICFKKWRREDGVKVLLHYCTAIAIQHILVLIFDFVDKENAVICSLYGALLHFSMLAQFMWMLIISFIQYEKLVKVFHSGPGNNKLLKLIAAAWIIPLIPISVVLSINIHSYQGVDYCFIVDLNLYLSLFLPVSLIIFVNTVIFTRIIISLFKGSSAVGKSIMKKKLTMTILLLFLTGFSWSFGLLANAFENILMSYLFCIMALAQGLVLWVYFILMRKEIIKFWKNAFEVRIENIARFQIPRPRLDVRSKKNTTGSVTTSATS